MKEENKSIYLHYPHCTKFTAGQLDRYPFSEYEMRETPAQLDLVWSEENGNEWRIQADGKILAIDEDLNTALANAQYELMADSRAAQQIDCDLTQLE